MGDFAFNEQQLGMVFAARLERLGRQAPSPEVQQKINALVLEIRRTYGMSDQEKVEVVFNLIVEGAVTAEELQWETGFRQAKIKEIVAALKTAKRVEARSIPSGRQGPPRHLLIPIEAPPR